MELMLSLRRMNGQYAKSKQQPPNLVSFTLLLNFFTSPNNFLAIVNAVKFSMKFADEDLEYNIKYAEILNKKSGSNEVDIFIPIQELSFIIMILF